MPGPDALNTSDSSPCESCLLESTSVDLGPGLFELVLTRIGVQMVSFLRHLQMTAVAATHHTPFRSHLVVVVCDNGGVGKSGTWLLPKEHCRKTALRSTAPGAQQGDLLNGSPWFSGRLLPEAMVAPLIAHWPVHIEMPRLPTSSRTGRNHHICEADIF